MVEDLAGQRRLHVHVGGSPAQRVALLLKLTMELCFNRVVQVVHEYMEVSLVSNSLVYFQSSPSLQLSCVQCHKLIDINSSLLT